MSNLSLSEMRDIISKTLCSYFEDRSKICSISKTALSSHQGSIWKHMTRKEGAVTPEFLTANLHYEGVSNVLQVSGYFFKNRYRSPENFDNMLKDRLISESEHMGDILKDQVVRLTMGGVSGNFIGLQSWISEDGSPGGISREECKSWKAYVNHNSGTPRSLTYGLMLSTLDTYLDEYQGRVTAIWMSRKMFIQYQDIISRGRPDEVKSAQSIENPVFMSMFQGIPVFAFSFFTGIPEDQVWFLDLDSIHYEASAPIISEARLLEDETCQWDITYPINLVVPDPSRNCAGLVDLR